MCCSRASEKQDVFVSLLFYFIYSIGKVVANNCCVLLPIAIGISGYKNRSEATFLRLAYNRVLVSPWLVLDKFAEKANTRTDNLYIIFSKNFAPLHLSG